LSDTFSNYQESQHLSYDLIYRLSFWKWTFYYFLVILCWKMKKSLFDNYQTYFHTFIYSRRLDFDNVLMKDIWKWLILLVMKNAQMTTSISFRLESCVFRLVFWFFRFYVWPGRFVLIFFLAKGLFLIIDCLKVHFTPYYFFFCSPFFFFFFFLLIQVCIGRSRMTGTYEVRSDLDLCSNEVCLWCV
jgi:hypothetical protein